MSRVPFPPLPRWATLYRPCGAWDIAQFRFPESPAQRAQTRRVLGDGGAALG